MIIPRCQEWMQSILEKREFRCQKTKNRFWGKLPPYSYIKNLQTKSRFRAREGHTNTPNFYFVFAIASTNWFKRNEKKIWSKFEKPVPVQNSSLKSPHILLGKSFWKSIFSMEYQNYDSTLHSYWQKTLKCCIKRLEKLFKT